MMAKTHSADDIAREIRTAAGRLRMRMAAGIFLRLLPGTAGAAVFIAGAAVLTLRFSPLEWSGGDSFRLLLFLLVTALAATLVAVVCRLPRTRRLVASIDEASGAGGWFLTAAETDLSAWRKHLPPIRLPGVEFRRRPAWLVLISGALFFAGAALVPEVTLQLNDEFMLDLSEEGAELQNQLNLLEQEELLAEPEAADLREQLRQLVENTDARDPGRGYEALESLRNKLDAIVEQASRETGRELRDLTLAAAAAEMLSTAPETPGLTPAGSEFSQLLDKLAAENPELARTLAEAGIDATTLNTREGRTRLAQALHRNAEELRQRLARLSRHRADDSDSACEVTAEDLADWLRENAPDADELAGVLTNVESENGTPGAGGATRGRADAELEFSGESPDNGARRREVGVSGDTFSDEGELIDTFLSAPDDEEAAEAAVAGRLRTDGDTAVEAVTSRIHPEHRAAVKRYFTSAGAEANE